MKSYDLNEIKARLPDYLHAIGTEVFYQGSKRLTAACPIHHGTKRNFHADLRPDGTWLWNCRSGCGGQGGTTLELHARLHCLDTKSADCITGAADILDIEAGNGPSSKITATLHRERRWREARQQSIAEERHSALTASLASRRMDLLTPYLSSDWRADFFHDSPFDLEPYPDAQARQMIEWLFNPHDILWMGDIHDSGQAAHRANFRPAQEWLSTRKLPPRLSAGTYRQSSISRSQTSLATRPYLVIESDDLIGHKPTTGHEREENRILNAGLMRFLANRFKLELRALIDTGGKSLHGWFSDPGHETTRALARLLDGLAIDPAVFHRASCAPLRTPGCLHEGTGNRASLYYLNPPF